MYPYLLGGHSHARKSIKQERDLNRYQKLQDLLKKLREMPVDPNANDDCKWILNPRHKDNMKYNVYNLDELELLFLQHADEADKNNKECIARFKENYPNDPLPDHMDDPFNLPEALAVMCGEIRKLQKKINSLV